MRAAIILGGLALLAGLVWLALQPARESHDLLISEAVAAPLEEGGAAAFLKIENRGKPDRLIGVEDFTFSEEFIDLFHVPGIGHGHLYVGGMKLGRLYTPEAYIGALPKGQHEIGVTLDTNVCNVT